jgi:limonene-1,2-epoxide hydrolase
MIHIPSDPSPIQADPLELVNAFHSAINNDDVDTMLALLTEDATVTDSGSMIQGKEEIRKWALHSQRMVRLRLRLIRSQVTDEKVFWYDVAHNGPEIQDRVYLLRWTAIFQNGKIKSLTVSLVPMPDGK